MTLPRDVQDAVTEFDEWLDAIFAEYAMGEAQWKTIRAHLLNQDAEIDRRFGIGGELIIARRERDALQSRLAAADAQLRLMHRVLACAVTVACADDGSAKDHELSKLESVLRDQGWITTATVPATPVDDYLQGAGDE